MPIQHGPWSSEVKTDEFNHDLSEAEKLEQIVKTMRKKRSEFGVEEKSSREIQLEQRIEELRGDEQ